MADMDTYDAEPRYEGNYYLHANAVTAPTERYGYNYKSHSEKKSSPP